MSDILVVGGGPVGLATAIAVTRAGFDCRVVERQTPPIDKACGEGLMSDGAQSLERLGVDSRALEAAGGYYPLRGIAWRDNTHSVRSDLPVTGAMGIRRIVLHEALRAAAEEAGVEILWGARLEGLDKRQGAWTAQTSVGALRPQWLIGADGLRSQTRRLAQLVAPTWRSGLRRRSRLGIRRHFRCTPWSGDVEVYWGQGVEAYVTPVSSDCVGIAFLWSAERRVRGQRMKEGVERPFDRLLSEFPDLEERIAGASVLSSDRGIGPLWQRARRVVDHNLILVGDAAGYRDAITGEGLTLGFRQVELLAQRLREGRPGALERDYAKLSKTPYRLIDLALLLSRSRGLRRQVLRALSRDPSIFRAILAVHLGARGSRFFRLWAAARLLRASVS